MPEASVIVLAYNSSAYLPGCLDALREQTHADFEVVVVDNASTDGSAELVARRHPEVRLVRSAENTGYAGGCNLGFRHARGEYLVVLGPDCEPEPGWLDALLAACREPGVGLVTSMVRHYDDRDRINACGNDVHVLGLAFCRGLDDPWQRHTQPCQVAAISGCSFAVPRGVLERIGSFDEDFFMYCEDTDLSVRAWLAGYTVCYVPGSVVYHRSRLDIGPLKFFCLERNRHLVLLKNFGWRTLASLGPALAGGELLMWAYAILRGPAFCAAKLRAWSWLLRNRSLIRSRRSWVRKLRRTPDLVVLGRLTWALPERQVLGGSPLVRALGEAVNAFFRGSLALARLAAR